MKNKILLSLFLLSNAWTLSPVQLQSQLLKLADSAGLFNIAIINIFEVRKWVKELIIGKYFYHGAELSLAVYNDSNNPLNKRLITITNRPEALYGATFIIISPDHPQLFDFVDNAAKNTVKDFVQKTKQRTLLDRYQNVDMTMIATNFYVQNPFTGEKMPLYVSDAVIDNFDIRTCHTHIAIPAHHEQDFFLAKQNHLPVKLVISSPSSDKTTAPIVDHATNELLAAYMGTYADCIVINSHTLNGSIKSAHDKAIKLLQEKNYGIEYKKPILYSFMNKMNTINDLQAIETLIAQENKTLTPEQKETLQILLLQAQSDFLRIVQQFLINAREAKELIIDLVEESCQLRNNKNACFLQWVKMKTTESEVALFKKDINSFYKFCKFSAELFDFLGDFGSSCTNALENLKKIQNNK